MKDVIVTVTGRQDMDGQSDVTAITVPGRLQSTAAGWELIYRQEEDGQTVLSRLYMEEGYLHIERQGAIQSTLVLAVGRRHKTEYSTPHGRLDIELETQMLEDRLTPDGGWVEARYVITINEVVTAQQTLSIEVKGADRECQR